ncbi:MAG: hypothetical protein HYX69_19915 [Planctomycetia bacterium]|nr:hypothetical protein [Planctomycetia bacterium]
MRNEFRAAANQIAALTAATAATTIDVALCALVADEDPPDLIVVAQSRPGEFSGADIERMRFAAPLARIVALLGAWCEGESRSGSPWPAVPRVYWHQWPAWFAGELRRLREGRCGALSLPITATEEERLLLDGEVPRHGCGSIAIATASREMTALLTDACRAVGYNQVIVPQSGTVEAADLVAAIWDQGTPGASDFVQLERVVQRVSGVPVIALLSFPRSQDAARAIDLGARAVVSKPLAVDELLAEIERVATV